MKYLKYFEDVNNSEVYEICKKYNIQNYTINKDGSIDVNGDVNLSNSNLHKLPLKFNTVSGNFYCFRNKLTTLEGSPQSVGGNFYCTYNQLTTLEGGPKSVGGNFDCYNNQLNTLDGSPISVGGYFNCSNNYLTALEGNPQSVGGYFNCSNNQLTTLKGGPKSVGGNFECSNNQLTTLEYVPQSVSGYFDCSDNPIEVVWNLISTDNKWDNDIMDLLNDYDIFRDNKTIILDRLNSFLEDIRKPSINKVKGYKLI